MDMAMSIAWLVSALVFLLAASIYQSKGLFLIAIGSGASAAISALSHDMTAIAPVRIEFVPIAIASFLAILIDEPEKRPVIFTETSPSGMGGTIATALTDADEKGEAIVLWFNTEWKARTPNGFAPIQKGDRISIISLQAGKLFGTRMTTQEEKCSQE
jgi:membrane protein implicated in regulation of membrane protease activity